MSDTTPFIGRIVLRNYKSIAACDVRLSNLTYLVGPNGSGKSNFLDSLRLVADSMRSSLDHALRDRGGIKEVRRRSGGHPTHFGVRLEFRLSKDVGGHFAFDVAARPRGAYVVQTEECYVQDHAKGAGQFYIVEEGKVRQASLKPPPAASKDRLYLVNVSGAPEFRPVFDALSGMGFYNLNPSAIRELQPADPGELLMRDGRNLASVLAAIEARNPDSKHRIEEYLARVVPGITAVCAKTIGPRETLEFRQDVVGSRDPWRLLAASMSDGTLRALGVLVALFQGVQNGSGRARLVGIEEPEVALHPAAAGILTDSLADASRHTQVLVTSHSPDLLDNDLIRDDAIIAVVSDQGETKLGQLDHSGRSALHDHLYTAGELLRMDQIRPDPAHLNRSLDQMTLFGNGSAECE